MKLPTTRLRVVSENPRIQILLLRDVKGVILIVQPKLILKNSNSAKSQINKLILIRLLIVFLTKISEFRTYEIFFFRDDKEKRKIAAVDRSKIDPYARTEKFVDKTAIAFREEKKKHDQYMGRFKDQIYRDLGEDVYNTSV